MAARGTLAQRTAYLMANSPHMCAGANAWIINLVGDGPVLQHPLAEIVTGWNKFYSACDALGVCDLAGILAATVRSWLTSGEAFIVLGTDPETGALTLQIIPPAQVDESRTVDLGGGHYITAGIETFRGRRLAYWLLPTPPDSAFAATGKSRPIPASDMIHVFEPPAPGAVRGVTPFAAALTRAVEVDKLEDGLGMLAQICALLGIYITDPSGNVTLGEPINGKRSEVSAEPGSVRIVPADSTVTTVNPPEFSGVGDFTRHMIRSLAAGMGLPYELVAHDLSQVNYSSARLGLMEFRRRVVALQKALLVGQCLNKIFRRFVALETLAGRLNVDLDTLADPTFIFPGWQPIDPEKETAADVAAIGARLKSRTEVISARGRDPSEVDREIADDPTPLPAAPPPKKEPTHA